MEIDSLYEKYLYSISGKTNYFYNYFRLNLKKKKKQIVTFPSLNYFVIMYYFIIKPNFARSTKTIEQSTLINFFHKGLSCIVYNGDESYIPTDFYFIC